MNMRDFLLMIKEKGEYQKKENESPEINSILSEAKTKQFIKETKNNSYELDVFGYDFIEKEDRKNNQNRPFYKQTVVHGNYIRNSDLRDFKPINNITKAYQHDSGQFNISTGDIHIGDNFKNSSFSYFKSNITKNSNSPSEKPKSKLLNWFLKWWWAFIVPLGLIVVGLEIENRWF